MGTKPGDWVGIIEAAYRPAPDDQAWMEGLVAAARPSLDDGLGVAAFAYDLDPAGARPPALRPVVSARIHPGAWAAVQHVLGQVSSRLARRAFSGPPCLTVSRLTRGLPRDRELIAASAEQLGFRDLLGVAAGDPSGTGLVLAAPRRHVAPVPRGAAVAWGRIAAHIAAGLRLRRLIVPASPDTDPGATEAILDPQGRVQHATAPAQPRACREALRAAALDRRRAGQLRQSDPAEAVAAWRALVAGRWSLVDHFDHDGRRFLLARRNDPDTRALGELTLRERQVVGYACLGHANKLIAYELGLSASSIATHLARAAEKLGADSRPALIRICTGLAVAAPGAAAGVEP
ncbi:MAG: response regulator transcription factor [Deltaproteobacteria bacterium]|nr:response regulator transcription factor [Deltaproteobacteria bacterium]